MKKLTAGIFATILGLTAMGAADAASNVASTAYVKGAIESLDSEKTATDGKYISSIQMIDGKIFAIGQKDLPADQDTTYTAGKFVDIDENNVITTTYTAGSNVQISDNGAISATDTTYTAGDGITLTGTEFSANVASVESGSSNVTVTNENGIVKVSVAADQDTTYTAGKFVNIDENNVITTTYGAGDNISIDTEGLISADAEAILETLQGEANAGNGYLLQSVTLEDGTLAAGTKVQILDTYPDASLPLTPAI